MFCLFRNEHREKFPNHYYTRWRIVNSLRGFLNISKPLMISKARIWPHPTTVKGSRASELVFNKCISRSDTDLSSPNDTARRNWPLVLCHTLFLPLSRCGWKASATKLGTLEIFGRNRNWHKAFIIWLGFHARPGCRRENIIFGPFFLF